MVKISSTYIKHNSIPKVLSDDKLPAGYWFVYDQCMELAKKNLEQKVMVQDIATPWIHLADAVSRGTISVLEAIDAIEAGFLPENLKVRESAYYHLL